MDSKNIRLSANLKIHADLITLGLHLMTGDTSGQETIRSVHRITFEVYGAFLHDNFRTLPDNKCGQLVSLFRVERKIAIPCTNRLHSTKFTTFMVKFTIRMVRSANIPFYGKCNYYSTIPSGK